MGNDNTKDAAVAKGKVVRDLDAQEERLQTCAFPALKPQCIAELSWVREEQGLHS